MAVTSPKPANTSTTIDERILKACRSTDLDDLIALLDCTAPSQIPNPQRLIGMAAHARNVPVVKYLVDRYPDITMQYPYTPGASLENSDFHSDIFKAGVEVYRVVFEKHPELRNECIGGSSTAVNEAIHSSDLDMLRFLINKGYDIHLGSGIDDCPHSLAESCAAVTGNRDIVDLLEEHGALPYGHLLSAIDQAIYYVAEDRGEVVADIRRRHAEGTLELDETFSHC